MNDLLNECLDDLAVALEWLELPYQQKPPKHEIEKCRANLAIVRAQLASKENEIPLKWLNLPTGAYHPLMRAGHQTIEAVVKLAPKQLMAIPGIGENYRNIIIEACEQWQLEKLQAPCPQIPSFLACNE